MQETQRKKQLRGIFVIHNAEIFKRQKNAQILIFRYHGQARERRQIEASWHTSAQTKGQLDVTRAKEMAGK